MKTFWSRFCQINGERLKKSKGQRTQSIKIKAHHCTQQVLIREMEWDRIVHLLSTCIFYHKRTIPSNTTKAERYVVCRCVTQGCILGVNFIIDNCSPSDDDSSSHTMGLFFLGIISHQWITILHNLYTYLFNICSCLTLASFV